MPASARPWRVLGLSTKLRRWYAPPRSRESRCRSQREVIRNFDIHLERRYRLAAVHPDLNLVRIECDVSRNHGENFFAQNIEQIRLADELAFVGEQDLQPLARDRRRAALSKQLQKIHAALRPNSLSSNPFR